MLPPDINISTSAHYCSAGKWETIFKLHKMFAPITRFYLVLLMPSKQWRVSQKQDLGQRRCWRRLWRFPAIFDDKIKFRVPMNIFILNNIRRYSYKNLLPDDIKIYDARLCSLVRNILSSKKTVKYFILSMKVFNINKW